MRCSRERLAPLLFAACTASPATTTSDDDDDDDGSSSAHLAESTSEAPTTGDLECGELTRCGQTCVDITSDRDNCGACGIACRIDNATTTCTNLTCQFKNCDPGHLDCDASLATGCETPGETCPLTCAPAHPELCNLFDDDCNDLCDDMAANCRHPVHRALSPTRGHLLTLDPSETSQSDYTPTTLDYLTLYTTPQPGLVPFYRCRLPDDFNYYTTSANCDDQATLVGTLGHLAPTPLCGAVPLFRLSNGTLTNYLYTHDPAERDDAITTQGYAYEAISGYVWTTL